jgi:hypothetical protein
MTLGMVAEGIAIRQQAGHQFPPGGLQYSIVQYPLNQT